MILPTMQNQISTLQLKNTPWPRFHHDNRSTGQGTYGSDTNGTFKWLPLEIGAIRSSPAIDSDGTIYIGASSGVGRIYAINPDRTQKWVTDSTKNINIDYSSIAISSTGTLYVGDVNANLHALDSSNGSIIWSYPTDASTGYSSPAIAQDGTIYIVSNSATLYAINHNGTLKWIYPVPGNTHQSTGSPVIASDGTIVMMTRDTTPIGFLIAIRPDGTLKWKYQMIGNVTWNSPSIGPNDITYAGDDIGNFYGIDINGNEVLKVKPFNNNVSSPPAFSQDNSTIYIGAGYNPLTGDYTGSGLYALNINTGAKIWYFPTPRQERCAPAVAANGIIYIGDDNYPSPSFYAINPDGSMRWSVLVADRIRSSPAIAVDGSVYVGDRSKNFYAFYSLPVTPPQPPVVKMGLSTWLGLGLLFGFIFMRSERYRKSQR